MKAVLIKYLIILITVFMLTLLLVYPATLYLDFGGIALQIFLVLAASFLEVFLIGRLLFKFRSIVPYVLLPIIDTIFFYVLLWFQLKSLKSLFL